MLEKNGFVRTDFDAGAGLYVINTCSVTENADREFRAIVRRVQKISPDAFIAVTGCYAQLKPEQIAAIPGVDLVLGAAEKFSLPAWLGSLEKKISAEIHSCEIEAAHVFTGSHSHGDRTRVFLKVQDGCDYNCTYCTIPLARGKSRSDSIANVVHSAQEIAAVGAKEIVLTGVNIGDFGHNGENFLSLITALDHVDAIERFRISSIEPNLLSDEIISFVASSKRFVPHFHVPLQSGSDKILKRMKRRYLRELYESRVDRIRSLMPHACIGADVITGFPGETDEDFLDTYDFLNRVDISYLHVFTYSERDNTEAAEMQEVVPIGIRRKRNKMLRVLSAKKQRAFYEKHTGEERSVLFESENKEGFLHGFTDNYIKVKTPFDEHLINKIVPVRLSSIDPDGQFVCETELPLTAHHLPL